MRGRSILMEGTGSRGQVASKKANVWREELKERIGGSCQVERDSGGNSSRREGRPTRRKKEKPFHRKLGHGGGVGRGEEKRLRTGWQKKGRKKMSARRPDAAKGKGKHPDSRRKGGNSLGGTGSIRNDGTSPVGRKLCGEDQSTWEKGKKIPTKHGVKVLETYKNADHQRTECTVTGVGRNGELLVS